VTHVAYSGSTLEIDVRTPGPLPDTALLMASLTGKVPDGTPVVVETNVGDRVDAGTTG
jgi:hypothetical protein